MRFNKGAICLCGILALAALLAGQKGQKPTTITVTVQEGTNIAATVSPDHRGIILDLQGTLWSLPVRGGTAKRLTDPMLEPSRPDYSPKGDLVAFQAYRGGYVPHLDDAARWAQSSAGYHGPRR